MIAAIDSLPLTDSIFSCSDYSGMQVHSLTNRPLSGFLPASMEGTRLRIDLGSRAPFWSDGSQVTAVDFLSGIQKACENGFVKSILLRGVERIFAQGQVLEFNLKRMNFRFLEVLSLSRFSPYRQEGLSSGQWIHMEDDHYVSHPYNSQESAELHLKLVKSPSENISLFENGKIDITADTAFPFGAADRFSDVNRQSVGLYSTLSFSGKCSRPTALGLRRAIADICAKLSFDSITYGCCPQAAPFLYEGAPSVVRESLTLAYDDFYPNREICELVAQALNSAGFQVTLVVDDYYRPSTKYDLKLQIIRGFGRSDYLLYAGLLFSEVLRNERESQVEFLKLIRELELQLDLDASRVKQFIADQALLVPLFEVKSLYLSRAGGNPLIEGWLCS